jgi:hypothetical protein
MRKFDMACLRSAIRGFALMLLGVVLAGCGAGGPEIAYVTGKVTMDGKPLPNATVVFVPENGRPAGATTNEEGEYVLNFAQGRKGAIPGESVIRIMTFRDADQDENGQSIPGAPETVPAEYNTESTLTFNVEPGKNNVANFDLKSGGKIAQRDS